MTQIHNPKTKSRTSFKLFGAALAAVVLSSSLSGAAIAPQQDQTLKSDVEIDRPVVLRGDTDPIFLLVRFEAKDFVPEEQKDRPPLNLSLVLDRSGSMDDKGKIEYLKQAAKMAVDRLTVRDHLAVVEYDDEITVMWPSQRVESTYAIKRLIDALSPRGSTDLVGGMMRGVDEVQNRMKSIDSEEAINRVLLLSDGLANVGVTDPRQIRRLVRAAKSDGVRVSTMGLGRDYDEDLMQDIAENAGGRYYYIEHPNQMARIFEQELETLFTTVAKDVRFEFRPVDGIKDVQVISFGDVEDPGSSSFDMESFYGGEQRTLLLRLEPDPDVFDRSAGVVDLGDIRISYKDVLNGNTAVQDANVSVQVTEDEDAVVQARNHAVIVEANLFEAERKHTEAIKLYEQGNYDEAEAKMNALEDDLRSQNTDLKDARLTNKMEALRVEREQMSSAQASASDRSAFLKSSKQRLYNAQTGKRALYMLQVGDKGFEVERLQSALRDAGYYEGDIDGVYSEEVKGAVEALQSDEGLSVDGVAGPATMDELSIY